jgi:DNA-binding CsgD family transcriptional regulator
VATVETGLIGRDADIAKIWTFISATSGVPAALVITGDAGIGRTAVWRHILQAAGNSSNVLSCRPTPAERLLPFSALDDLFGDVTAIVPANHAPPDQRSLARGILEAVQVLSESKRLIVAVDDAQWLDRPSASVLQFCFRRFTSERVFVLLTFRSGDEALLGLDGALAPDLLGRAELGPLTLAAIGEILRIRLGAALPRYALTRLYDTCGGNPFYALELARVLVDHPHLALPREPIPLPRSLDTLVRRRLRRLPADVRRVGRLVAASCEPRERRIRAACDDGESWTAIDQAIDKGIIERDGDLLRFTHPLLRSVLYADMTMTERRHVHRLLADVADGVEDRAWHLALGADRPSEDIAGLLDSVARHAAARGAPDEGAALTEQAVRLTPATLPEVARAREVRAADYHFCAGSMARSQELIRSALAASPAGSQYAALLVRLAAIHSQVSGWPLAEETFRQAVTEAADDPALRAHAERELAFARMVAGDLPAAQNLARTSLRSAEQAGDRRLMAHSLARIVTVEFLQGNGMRMDLLDKAEELSASLGEDPPGPMPLHGPRLVRGLVLKWSDQLDEARVVLADEYQNALDRGDKASLPFLLCHFSELESWAGNWATAEEYALEGCRVAEEGCQLTMRPAALYSLALVRAYQGHLDQARKLAVEALEACEQTGNVHLVSQLLSVLGFAALSAGDYQAAVSHLCPLIEPTAAFGLGEPGMVRFIPDAIKALAAVGQVERARLLAEQLNERGKSLGRPWAVAAAARCRAHLCAIDGDLQAGEAACEQALLFHEKLAMPFDLGRTLLVKGMIERRGRRKSAAQATLGEALGIFEKIGAPLWADKARGELSKIGARAPVEGLTETESRIASLVARGQTNRQVASAMFISENTVQTHVRHIFRKLGVRSRTELAAGRSFNDSKYH